MKRLSKTLFGLSLVLGSSAAMAQTLPPAPPVELPAPGANRDFLDGLRRIGALAGQDVVCTPDASRTDQIQRMAQVGMELSAEYGLRAAFNFIGAAGYGSGLPFDKASCPKVIKQWQAIETRYRNG